MPLVKRAIEPVFISRGELDKRVKNELEGVVVNSLAGVIKELSSLSKHADNLFGELFYEATNIFNRSAVLSQRVEEIHQHVRQMDSNVKDDVKVEDIVAMNHFKSSRQEDQYTLSRDTLPTALQEVHYRCEAPPALQEFTQYREDQKDGLRFYTDSGYFYRLWVEEQNQLLEKKKRRERRRRRKKDHKPKKEIQAAQKKVYIGADAEFRDEQSVKLTRYSQVSIGSEQQQSEMESAAQADPMPKYLPPDHGPPLEEPSKPVYAPPTPPQSHYAPPSNSPQLVPKPMAPPPPPPPTYQPSPLAAPPPPMSHQPSQAYPNDLGYPNAPPPLQELNHNPSPYNQPPPMSNAPAAPPPPPVNIPAPPPPPIISPANLAPPPPGGGPAPNDNRSDLLSAIRFGKQLRKVERTQGEKRPIQYGSDVASILARRIAVEVSDSESGSDYSDSDSDWSD